MSNSILALRIVVQCAESVKETSCETTATTKIRNGTQNLIQSVKMSNLSSSSTTTGKGDSRVSYNASYDQLTYKSRVISSVLGDTERHRFLVGTHSLTSKNEIHLIEYLEDKKSIVAAKIFKHQNEIWSISPHPKNPDLFWTVYNTGKNFKTSLWKNSYSDGKSHELSEVVSIDGLADPIQK